MRGLYLLDYKGSKAYTGIDPETIRNAVMSVVSGDEVLDCLIETGDSLVLDPFADTRWMSCFDMQYFVIFEGEWVVDKEKFMNRTSSYWIDPYDISFFPPCPGRDGLKFSHSITEGKSL